jgi:hypothetical protein
LEYQVFNLLRPKYKRKALGKSFDIAGDRFVEIEGRDPIEPCEVSIKHDSPAAHDMDALLNFWDWNEGRGRLGHKWQADGWPNQLPVP